MGISSSTNVLRQNGGSPVTPQPGRGAGKAGAGTEAVRQPVQPTADIGVRARQAAQASPLQPSAPQTEDWEGFLKECLSYLGNSYQGISVTVAELGEEGLLSFAASAGPGRHLVVSKEFLRRMVANPEAYQKGKEALSAALQGLSSQRGKTGNEGAYLGEDALVFWTVGNTGSSALEEWGKTDAVEEEKIPTMSEWEDESEKNLLKMMQEALKRAKENKSKIKMKYDSSLLRSRGETMARLAKAATPSEARAAGAEAKRNICTLKLALSLGEEKDKPKIRAAIAGLEKVVSRSSRKVRELGEESRLRARQKKAEQAQRRKRAERLKQELKQRKTSRQTREYGQVREERNAALEWELREIRDERPDWESQENGFSDMGGTEAGAVSSVEGVETGGVPVTEVYISPAVEFV